MALPLEVDFNSNSTKSGNLKAASPLSTVAANFPPSHSQTLLVLSRAIAAPSMALVLAGVTSTPPSAPRARTSPRLPGSRTTRGRTRRARPLPSAPWSAPPSSPPSPPPLQSLFLPHIILLLSSLHTLRYSTPILSPLSTAAFPSLVVPTSCPTPLPQTPSCLPTSSLTT